MVVQPQGSVDRTTNGLEAGQAGNPADRYGAEGPASRPGEVYVQICFLDDRNRIIDMLTALHCCSVQLKNRLSKASADAADLKDEIAHTAILVSCQGDFFSIISKQFSEESRIILVEGSRETAGFT